MQGVRLLACFADAVSVERHSCHFIFCIVLFLSHTDTETRYIVFAKSSSRAFSVSIVYFHCRDVLFMIRCTFLSTAEEKYWLTESRSTATVDCGNSIDYVVIHLVITLLSSLYKVSCVLTTYAYAHCHKDFVQSDQICCNHEIDECKLKMMIDANTRYHLHVFQQRHHYSCYYVLTNSIWIPVQSLVFSKLQIKRYSN